MYQDIKRLVALAYLGETGRVIDHISIDAFTDALDDQALRIKILEREPKTLDEALNIGLRLEALHLSGKTDQAASPSIIIDDNG